MDDIGAKEEVTRFLAGQDAQALAQALLELAGDYPPVYQRLERLRLQSDPAALTAQFNLRLKRWENNDRYVQYQDAGAFGRELDVWVAQVQREVLPRFPSEAMALFAAFLELDRVVFERVDDDGGYVGGAFEFACRLWLTPAWPRARERRARWSTALASARRPSRSLQPATSSSSWRC